jgi:hypothetical protein
VDVEIGEIHSDVRVVDEATLVSPQIKRMLMKEMMKHVADREDHAARVQRERSVNAGRTTETLP